MRKISVAALLSFNGGFVDTAGFLGLQGLFTAHITGNFVTLASTLVQGTHGVIAKLIALPEFVIIVALTRMLGTAMTMRELPALRLLLSAKVLFLIAFFVLAVALGPFPNSDAPIALVTGFTGVAGMAIQNVVQRVHYSSIPPTTLMTGNTTQAVIDAVDIMSGAAALASSNILERFGRTIRSVIWFALGCALSAAMFYFVGFWCLAVPVVVGVGTAILGDK
jgi:uncharacterized membrane protein YoaK (UPF0700 family)